MGWVIGLLALIAAVLVVGLGLLIWVIDAGLAQIRQQIQWLRGDIQNGLNVGPERFGSHLGDLLDLLEKRLPPPYR